MLRRSIQQCCKKDFGMMEKKAPRVLVNRVSRALLPIWVPIVGGTLLFGSQAAHAQAAGDASANASPAVPVTTAPAQRKDFPIFLNGIGNVQPLNTVLIRARVDGTLDSLNFREGQEVKKGDLIAVIDPRPYQAVLDQAMAKKAQDEAILANAKLDLARFSNLARNQFASQQSVDTQRATVSQQTAQLKGDDAAIEAAALNLSFTHITSPLDGRVGLRQVDPGNLIHASDTNGIVTITQLHPITVVFTLPEESVPQVAHAIQNGAHPLVEAYSSDGTTELASGTLLTPDNAIDTTTGTIKLKAVFANTENRLWPGQFVNARLQVDVRHDAVTVPVAAVQRGQDNLFVYVVKPDSTVAIQPVEELLEQNGTAVITKGLQGNEQVVTNGQSRLTDGIKVAARSGQNATAGSGG
jgi:multidrug efflux system membrane fusion protein